MSRLPLLLASFAVLAPAADIGLFRGVNVSGAEFGENTIPGTYGTNYTYNSPRTFQYFAARNLNVIRLQVRWERLQPVLGGPLDLANLGYLKQDIAAAKKAGALISIDVHNYGRYKINDTAGVLQEYVLDNVYNNSVVVNTANLADLWVKLSNEFRNEPAVVAYDIMNEPHDMGTANWNQMAQAVLTAVRNTGDTKLIMIPGDSYSSATYWADNQGPKAWIIDPANNFLYEAHLYFDSNFSGTYTQTYDQELAANPQLPTIGVTRLMPFLNWCANNSAPCYLGEYGIPNDDPRWETVLDNFLAALDGAGMPGTYWAAGEWWSDYKLSVQPAGDFAVDRPQTHTLLAHLAPRLLTTLSAAADYGYALAPGSLAAGYGAKLSTGTQGAPSLPLGTQLQGTQVQLTDSAGAVSFAPLLFVSANQVNYEVPAATPPGRVDVKVISNGSIVASGVLEIETVAPTLFSADNSGTGPAVGTISRVHGDGSVTREPANAPIVFGSDRLTVTLYGTGFDEPSRLSNVSLTVGSTSIAPSYAASQLQYAGLDQINAELPSTLAGKGVVAVTVVVDGKASNPVSLTFR